MLRIVVIVLLVNLSLKISAQNSSSIAKWNYSVVDTNGNNEIRFNVTIKEGWHLYSQFITGDGPIPTTFVFIPNENYTLIGGVKEKEAHTAYDPNFDMQISYFEGSTVFTQEVKNNTSQHVTVKGSIEFMVCDDKMCYPPEIIDIHIVLP